MMNSHYRSIRSEILKIITVSNAGKDAEKLDLSYVTGGNDTLENSLAVSLKPKHILTIPQSSCKYL